MPAQCSCCVLCRQSLRTQSAPCDYFNHVFSSCCRSWLLDAAPYVNPGHASCPPLFLVQAIFKRLSMTPHSSQDPRVSIESGPCTFYYLIGGNACFLTLTEKGYPKKLAFQYLEELAREFNQLYGSQVDSVTRPYAFIKFGEHCQRQ